MDDDADDDDDGVGSRNQGRVAYLGGALDPEQPASWL